MCQGKQNYFDWISTWLISVEVLVQNYIGFLQTSVELTSASFMYT